MGRQRSPREVNSKQGFIGFFVLKTKKIEKKYIDKKHPQKVTVALSVVILVGRKAILVGNLYLKLTRKHRRQTKLPREYLIY